MNQYMMVGLGVLFVYIVITVVIDALTRDKVNIKKRKAFNSHKKGERTSTDGALGKFTDNINEKADLTKKYEIETMCRQAGHEMSYGEFKVTSIACGIILPLIMLIVMNNIFLSIIFLFVGYNLPAQIFKTLANKRVEKIDKQVGAFMSMLTERVKTKGGDMGSCIEECLEDFSGIYPFYDDLERVVIEMSSNKSPEYALDDLARRTGNKYLQRYADFFKLSLELSDENSKIALYNQSLQQYEDNRKLKGVLREKIAGPVRDAYIMIGAIPVFMIYQCFATTGYFEFMTTTTMGQAGIAGTMLVLLGSVWFVNAKIGAPLD